MTSRTRILVLGAGYGGLVAAERVANRLHPDTAEVVMITAEREFVERPRLHQVAAGQNVPEMSLTHLLRRSPILLKHRTVTAIRPDHDVVQLSDGQQIGYDRLIIGLGSQIDPSPVPGVAENALLLTDRRAAERARRRLFQLPTGAAVTVCGGGLTGIEIATEFAESRPDLAVRLVSRSVPGGWLSPRAARYLHRVFDALDVTRVAGTVTAVQPDRLELTDNRTVPADLTLWAGGFRATPLVAGAGLEVDAAGRAVTDRSLRSVSHPQVRVVGDAAAVPGPWGDSLAMGCRTGGFTGPVAADALAAELTGRPERQLRFRYLHECISLGRRHGLVQFLDATGNAHRRVLKGRLAIAYKNATLNGARMLFRHPGPCAGRRRPAVAPEDAVR